MTKKYVDEGKIDAEAGECCGYVCLGGGGGVGGGGEEGCFFV